MPIPSRRMLGLVLMVVMVAPLASVGNAAARSLETESRAVVKLYVTRQRWDVRQPWTKTRPHKTTCSGFFIEPGILTNAHCIADATFIQVEMYGRAAKLGAQVTAVNHQIDLALLQLDEPGGTWQFGGRCAATG